MSDIEKYTNTQVDTVSQAPMSQGTLAMLNLEQQAAAMQNALTIAQAMCATQMVPKAFFRKPEDGPPRSCTVLSLDSMRCNHSSRSW